jgi:bifunctional ADP-heptose synthase (sugar kinase/adenylyltransferase)
MKNINFDSSAVPAIPRTQLAAARVLVVGDVMLDRYWFGCRADFA